MLHYSVLYFFVFKQKTAYEMRISDWSSDVCSSDLGVPLRGVQEVGGRAAGAAVDVIADGLAVDQHVHRLTNGRIGQRRVLGAERRARAVHLFPRVGRSAERRVGTE